MNPMRKTIPSHNTGGRTGSNDLSALFRTTGRLVAYQFPNLSEYSGIKHGIFTRLSGFSDPPFDSLNVGMNVGDDPNHVNQNRAAIARCLGMDEMVFLDQVHGADIICLKQGAPEKAFLSVPQKGDALITDMPGKLIAIQAADCQPVLLYEPIRNVIAVVHSGWRGSIQNVIGRTIQRMKMDFGCAPEKIVAGIGPSLGPCCGEFIHYRQEIPEKYWSYNTGNNHFDFWAISRDQLTQAGVLPGNIHNSGLCTRCRTEYFFSFRARSVTGRFAGAIGLDKPHPSGPRVERSDNQLNS